MTARRSTSWLGLFRHLLGAERIGGAVIALLVLLGSAAAVLAPRMLDTLAQQELGYSVQSLSGLRGELAARTSQAPLVGAGATGPAAEVWGAMLDGAAAMPSAQSELLGAQTTEPRVVASIGPYPVPVEDIADDEPHSALRFISDPQWQSTLTLVEGEWPDDGFAAYAEWWAELQAGAFSNDSSLFDTSPPTLQIALTQESADRLSGWQLGERREAHDTLPIGWELPVPPMQVELTAIVAVVDEEDTVWSRNPSGVRAAIFDDGNVRPTATAGAFTNPAALPGLLELGVGNTSRSFGDTQIWYQLDPSGITTETAPELARQLTAMTTRPVGIVPGFEVQFSSDLGVTLDRAVTRSAATAAVVLSVAAGPLAVLLAVLGLVARLVIERRRTTLALLAARGASAVQLRLGMAVSGLIVGIPAATVGTGLAVALSPGAIPDAPALALPALIALVPALLLALGTAPTGLRSTRTDLDARSRGRFRWIAELLAVIAAVTAVTLLLVRGLDSPGGEIDPVLVGAPMLVALAFCVVLLRLYPVPLAALERRVKRGPGLVGFLGAARARRDLAGGLSALLALTLSVAVLAFSATMIGTLGRGVDAGAQSTVGGDLRIQGPTFTEEQLAQLADVEGVDAIVPLYSPGLSPLRSGEESPLQVTVFVADLSSLASLQAGLADGVVVGEAEAKRDDGSVPVILSSDVPGGDELTVDRKAITAVQRVDRFAGSGEASAWVLVDREFANDLGIRGFHPKLVLFSLDDPAETERVLEDIRQIAPDFSWTSQASVSEEVRGSPSVAGLPLAFWIAGATVALLTAVALILVIALGAASRTALLARLRTLGLDRAQSRRLVAWEAIPLVGAALLGGVVLAGLLTTLMTSTVPLRPFTEGPAQPPIHLDPALTGGALGGFFLVSSVVVLVAVRRALSTDEAKNLRMGDEQ